jgi:hypothetical protein
MNYSRLTLLSISLLLLLTASSCGRKRMRAGATKDLGKALIDALREKDVEKFLTYYPAQSDLTGHEDEFFDDPEADPSSDYSYASQKRERLSDNEVHHYFDDDLAKMKKDFREVLDAGDDKGISWKKARFIRSEVQPGANKDEFQKPIWIRIWAQSEGKRFCIVLNNAIRTSKGWNSGLSMKLSDRIYDYSMIPGGDAGSGDDDSQSDDDE